MASGLAVECSTPLSKSQTSCSGRSTNHPQGPVSNHSAGVLEHSDWVHLRGSNTGDDAPFEPRRDQKGDDESASVSSKASLDCHTALPINSWEFFLIGRIRCFMRRTVFLSTKGKSYSSIGGRSTHQVLSCQREGEEDHECHSISWWIMYPPSTTLPPFLFYFFGLTYNL